MDHSLGFQKETLQPLKKWKFSLKMGVDFFLFAKKTACIGFGLMCRFCENLIKISPVAFVLDLGSDNDISIDKHCP